MGRYTVGESLKNAYSLALTKLFFPEARLVRRPAYVRGKEHLAFGCGFTTGYGCRFDLGGEGKTLSIGKNCKLGDRVHFVARESVTVGDDVLMASHIFISDTSHGAYTGESQSSPDSVPDERELVTAPVRIGDKVWIGEGVCILPGVTIGNGSIIGSNAVVTKSIPANSIAVGCPAKPIKQWDAESSRWVGVNA